MASWEALGRLGIVVVLEMAACASDDVGDDHAEADATVAEEDAMLEDACRQWCVASSPCSTAGLTEDECTMACLADVGTPGPECTAALVDLATCLEASCEMGCSDELGARDLVCGGTG